MKSITTLILVFTISCCYAQKANLLLNQTLVSDFTDDPIYERLTLENEGQPRSWKTPYQYIDSINIFDITYLSDGLKIKGWMAKPQKEGTYPCIIFNRGGNRDFGALSKLRSAFLLGRLAKEGYIVIASQYRGGGGSEGQEEFGGKDVNDVIQLIDVLAEVEGADTSKIGMYGWSRGGMMTYIALTQTDRIKAAAVGGAVSDNFATIEDRPDMETYVLAELIPNYDTKKEEELTKRSAIKWADKFPKDVPVLLLHGNSDWRVKCNQSLKMAMALDKVRVPYRLVIFEGADHGISEHKEEVNKQILDWFDKYLKNGEALPNMEYHGR